MIKGENIILRRPEITDVNDFYRWHNDAELKKLAMLHPFQVSLEEEKDWLTKLVTSVENKNITLLIVEYQTNLSIGYAQLKNINWINKNAWFGIIIGEAGKRNKGYGKETTNLIIHYAFNQLNLDKIQLEVLEFNRNAIQLYLRFGFVEEGHLNNHFYYDGAYFNVKLMTLFKENWKI